MRIAPLVVVLLAAGCAGRGTPVAMQGAAPDRAQLSGAWAGEFAGESGRAGTIHFELAASADSAWGNIQLAADDARPTAPGLEGRPTMAPPPVVLSIRFVRVAGDRVRGVLDPYRDPQCGCRVTTVFDGVLRGDVITGEYVTRHTEHAREVRGTWRVQRLPAR